MAKTATLNDIITLPNAHLREHSRKVGIISSEILDLISRMESATLDWEASREHEVGVALAAVQINELYRAVVIRNDFDNKEDLSFTAYINPVITKYEGKILEDYEGCLSIKDIYGRVPRYEKIKVKALGLDGNEFRVNATGFLARVFQHEIDHINGIVFIDHIKEVPDAFFTLDTDGHLTPKDYEKDVLGDKSLFE